MNRMRRMLQKRTEAWVHAGTFSVPGPRTPDVGCREFLHGEGVAAPWGLTVPSKPGAGSSSVPFPSEGTLQSWHPALGEQGTHPANNERDSSLDVCHCSLPFLQLAFKPGRWRGGRAQSQFEYDLIPPSFLLIILDVCFLFYVFIYF